MPDEPLELVPFGITGLDTALGGGIPAGSTTMVLGSPGSGKTLLGLHFLMAGARVGEHALLFGFYETPPRLVRKSEGVNLPVREAIAQGLLEIAWQPPIANLLDELGERLLTLVERRQVRRLFIDGLAGLQVAAPYADRFFIFLTALINELRARDVTTLLSVELRELFGPAVDLPIESVSAIIDNTMLLRHVELQSQLYRLLSIINIRESGYDSAIREFRITDRGIEVAATFASAEAILTGVARPRERRPTSARTQRRARTGEGTSDDDSGR
jgi:circadian clock protein KaiC